jgi:hypothetical protein
VRFKIPANKFSADYTAALTLFVLGNRILSHAKFPYADRAKLKIHQKSFPWIKNPLRV